MNHVRLAYKWGKKKNHLIVRVNKTDSIDPPYNLKWCKEIIKEFTTHTKISQHTIQLSPQQVLAAMVAACWSHMLTSFAQKMKSHKYCNGSRTMLCEPLSCDLLWVPTDEVLGLCIYQIVGTGTVFCSLSGDQSSPTQHGGLLALFSITSSKLTKVYHKTWSQTLLGDYMGFNVNNKPF